jgi:hypothetical protein
LVATGIGPLLIISLKVLTRAIMELIILVLNDLLNMVRLIS